jgi:hypothetical protein
MPERGDTTRTYSWTRIGFGLASQQAILPQHQKDVVVFRVL